MGFIQLTSENSSQTCPQIERKYEASTNTGDVAVRYTVPTRAFERDTVASGVSK